MHRDEEDARVRVEDLLRRVAVMDVPVDDQDTLHLVAIEEDLRRDGQRVEVTEAPGGQ